MRFMQAILPKSDLTVNARSLCSYLVQYLNIHVMAARGINRLFVLFVFCFCTIVVAVNSNIDLLRSPIYAQICVYSSPCQ